MQMSVWWAGLYCFTDPDVMDLSDLVHVYGVAITETDMAKEKWSTR